jgi:hypothetical protein
LELTIMSPTTVPIRSSFQSRIISEESYCSPWDLKIQEEKLKLLNEQHHISLSFNQKPFHRTNSARSSTRKNSFKHRELSPPAVPPFPSGGLIPSCQCGTNNITEQLAPQTVRSDADTSRSFLFASKSPPNRRTQRIETVDTQSHLNSSIQNNSLPKAPTSYEQSWSTLQTSLINNLHGRSLQKIPSTKQHCSSPPFPLLSSCRHSDDMITIPIDRYL